MQCVVARGGPEVRITEVRVTEDKFNEIEITVVKLTEVGINVVKLKEFEITAIKVTEAGKVRVSDINIIWDCDTDEGYGDWDYSGLPRLGLGLPWLKVRDTEIRFRCKYSSFSCGHTQVSGKLCETLRLVYP